MMFVRVTLFVCIGVKFRRRLKIASRFGTPNTDSMLRGPSILNIFEGAMKIRVRLIARGLDPGYAARSHEAGIGRPRKLRT